MKITLCTNSADVDDAEYFLYQTALKDVSSKQESGKCSNSAAPMSELMLFSDVVSIVLFANDLGKAHWLLIFHRTPTSRACRAAAAHVTQHNELS